MLRISTFALALVAANGLAQTIEVQPVVPQPHIVIELAEQEHAEKSIEVVFVLDTTGSMSGLIEAAKQRIWTIANQIVAAEPRPTVRMGLIGYRDRGDDYVTVSTSLTEDLDAVYSDLMAYNAVGGGDNPESVNQALHEAVTGTGWTARDAEGGADTLRLIYLVGDAPPHMDYEQDVKYQTSCEEAAKRGIIVNTIQCGAHIETTPIWQEIARLAEGEYFAIEQSGGVVAIATPYDEELASLSSRLSDTLIAYGTRENQKATSDRQERARRLAADAPAGAAAERAMYLAKDEEGATLAGEEELVQAVADGRVRLDEVPDEELPQELRDLEPEARRAYVEEKAAERAELQARIQEIATQREEFLRAEMARHGEGNADAFDTRVLETLRAQAARVGIRYE